MKEELLSIAASLEAIKTNLGYLDADDFEDEQPGMIIDLEFLS